MKDLEVKLEQEAQYYEKKEDGSVRCQLCPHFCSIKDGKVGLCRGRKNIDGSLIAINYGRVCTIAVDPMEKKPMYHLYPGSMILSTGPNGCNLRCRFCQNWQISQEEVYTRYVSPEDLVKSAIDRDLIGISYTYTEPLIWYEYVYDCAKLARENGLINVLVSNGTINPEPFKKLVPYIDGMNVDLKSMNEEFYRRLCNGHLNAVLEIIKIAAKETLLEVTNLLVTDENDSEDDIHRLVDFIAGVDDEIPVHFSRYSPQYKMKNPATPVERLFRAREIAQEKLKYVYLGNIVDEESSATYCPNCNEILVKRGWFSTQVTNVKDGKCGNCGTKINIVT